jgi:hypothetical protein
MEAAAAAAEEQEAEDEEEEAAAADGWTVRGRNSCPAHSLKCNESMNAFDLQSQGVAVAGDGGPEEVMVAGGGPQESRALGRATPPASSWHHMHRSASFIKTTRPNGLD